MLRTRFPTVKFRFGIKHLYHLSGLKAILKHRLMMAQPDIAVISLPAMFAATSWRVNLVYEMAPEIVDTARSFMQMVEAKISGTRKAETLIDKAVSIRPPITLGEYERLIDEAVEHCPRTSSCRVVLMGPGRFNEDSAESYTNHSPEVWSSVNRMVLRSGQRLDVPVIDAQEALGGYGGESSRRKLPAQCGDRNRRARGRRSLQLRWSLFNVINPLANVPYLLAEAVACKAEGDRGCSLTSCLHSGGSSFS